jgi:hypothetical protein
MVIQVDGVGGVDLLHQLIILLLFQAHLRLLQALWQILVLRVSRILVLRVFRILVLRQLLQVVPKVIHQPQSRSIYLQ